MKFALVNGHKETPTPQIHGECPCCGSKVISKCGDKKLWHWAHYSKRDCDVWWENETQWHRDWKGRFPEDWQEVIHHDEHGEKHIADVKTAQGWILEFQHSFLKPQERNSRNNFYKKIVWVVDGLRRKRDKEQFFKLINGLRPICSNPLVLKVDIDGCALIREWSENPGPVFFDFGENILWCLLPVKQNMWGYIVAFSSQGVVNLLKGADGGKNKFETILYQLNVNVTLLEQKRVINRKIQPFNFILPRRQERRRKRRF